jgi:hypothetical protein
MLTEPGRKLTQEDLLMLTYNVGAADRSLVSHPVEVLSSHFENGFLEIEGQVSDLYEMDLADSKRLDLTFVFLDRAGSVDFELGKAMADLEKAQEEMDKKLEAMAPEQREKLMADIDKAIAEAERNPPPPPPDPGKEPLQEGVVITHPVVLRPVEIKLPVPSGWRSAEGNRRWIKVIERVINQPQSGARIYANGRLDYQLSSGDLAGGDYASLQGKGKPYRIEGWTGWREDKAPSIGAQPADSGGAESRRDFTTQGSIALRKGEVFLSIRYSLDTSGFRRVNEKKEVEYDTFEQAEKEFDRLQRDIAQMIDQGKAVAGGTTAPTASALREPQKDYAKGVRLVAAKTKLAPGEVIEIRAVVDGLGPDERIIRYDWQGNHEGKDEAVRFFASEPGSYNVGVNVIGAKGTLGSGWIDLEVR